MTWLLLVFWYKKYKHKKEYMKTKINKNRTLGIVFIIIATVSLLLLWIKNLHELAIIVYVICLYIGIINIVRAVVDYKYLLLAKRALAEDEIKLPTNNEFGVHKVKIQFEVRTKGTEIREIENLE